jgi:adenylate cyclase
MAGKIALRAQDMGDQNLKNIARPVRAYRVSLRAGSASPPATGGEHPVLPLPDKPSIAVLPFQNMSGDPEQEYFADGMVEEIITALSRFHRLFVIARNSSFSYKGKAVDVKQVGRELGVRYVLEGSVRKAGTRVRITGQLIDAANGVHLWADRFEGALENIFELQDQVTASVVGAIWPKLESAEVERSRRKPTISLDAYDYFLRGIAELYPATKEGSEEALRLLYKAIELDPNFASAYGIASCFYNWRRLMGWATDAGDEMAEMRRLAQSALKLGKDDAVALAHGALSLYELRQPNAALTFIDRALELNPNLAIAWSVSGYINLALGHPDLAIERFAKATRLSPFDQHRWWYQIGTAFAHFFAGRYEEAASWGARVSQENPSLPNAHLIFAAASAMAGLLEPAHAAMARYRERFASRRISNLHEWAFYSELTDYVARYAEALRRAGMPE